MRTTTTLHDKHKLARAVQNYAAALLRRVYPATGVTIVVHTAELRPGKIQIAVSTTLATRAQQRLLLAEALAQSLIADGVDRDNVAEAAARELAEFEGYDLSQKSER